MLAFRFHCKNRGWSFRAACCWGLWLLAFCWAGATQATSYSLPMTPSWSGPFAACTGPSGSTYTCPGNVAVGNNDTLNFTAPMTLRVTGNFTQGNSGVINSNGNAVTIRADGNMTVGNSFTGTVSFSAGGNIVVGNNADITGNMDAGASIVLGNGSVVHGTCTPSPTGGGSCAAPLPTLSIANASTVEGNSGSHSLSFTITQSAVSALTTSVSYSTANGTATGGVCGNAGVDFATTSGTASIAPGATSTTVSVSVCGDTSYEGDESFTVTLASPVNASLSTAVATGTILNDDAPPLVVEYRFDEALWNGTTGEIRDTSGNGYHATASLATNQTGIPGPAYASGLQSTCRYGMFDGGAVSKSYVQLPNSFPGLSGSFSFTGWINSTNASAQHQRIFVRDDNQDGWALSLADGTGTSILRFFNRNVTFTSPVGGVVAAGGVAINSNFQLSSNTWYFVAFTVDTVGKTAVIYVYDGTGAQMSRMSASFTGAWGVGTGATSIGGETSASSEGQQSSWHFLGRIDEVRVYSGALTQTLVEALLPTVRTCVDHYEVSLPSSSITCLPSTVTVKACADTTSPCTTTASSVSNGTATLATAGATLGASTLTFNGSGIASTTLSYPSASNGTSVSVTLSGETIVATNPRTCCANGSSCSVANSCSTTFDKAGLIFSTTTSGTAAAIPVQTAGTASGTVYLRAVQSDAATAACVAAVTGTRTVNMALQCNNPTTCYSSNLMSVNGGSATTIQGNPNSGVTGYTPVSVTFDTNGNAPFTLNYADVGQVSLWASTTLNGATLTGSSNAFVTKPGGFLISAVQQTVAPQLVNPAAANAAGAKFVMAGEAFSATAKATTSGGVAVPNFGHETVPEGVLLTRSLVQPPSGAAGTLSNGTIAGTSFTNGVATVSNLAWDQVGIIALTPSVADGDYLGSGNVTGTSSGNIGRFYPHHFDTSVVQGCPAGAYTYSGQPMAVTVTAKNLSGTTMANFDTASFAKAVTLSNASAVAGSLTAASVPATAFSAGIASGAPVFAFASPSVPASITVRATDSVDGESSATGTEGSAAIRSGRARMLNAYGSELLDLPLVLRTEYLQSSPNNWQLHSADRCSTAALSFTAVGTDITSYTCVWDAPASPASGAACLTTPPVANRKYLEGGVSGIDSGGVAGFAGNFNVWLKAPGLGHSGSVDVTANVPVWLQYNWSGTVGNPRGRATFGSMKSPVLYRRENY